jgi:integral membrane sensor domain MASE1
MWWFPDSAMLGVLLMMAFPSWTNFNMACLGLLAGLKPTKDRPMTRW